MPATFRFYTEGVEENERRFGDASKKIPREIEASLREFGEEAVAIFRRKTPRGATSGLRKGTRYRLTGPQDVKRIEIMQVARGENNFSYGTSVRFGAKPSQPPLDPIVEWLTDIAPRRPQNLETFDKEWEAKQNAFGIALHLAEKGIKRNRYHIRAVREIDQKTGQLVQTIGRRVSATLR